MWTNHFGRFLDARWGDIIFWYRVSIGSSFRAGRNWCAGYINWHYRPCDAWCHLLSHIPSFHVYVYTLRSHLICFCRNRFVSFLFVSFIESESWWPGCFHSFPTSQVDACLSEIHLLGARSSPANPKSVRSTICSTVRSATSLRLSSYRFRGWAARLSNACQPSPGATIKLCRRCQPGKAWQTLHAWVHFGYSRTILAAGSELSAIIDIMSEKPLPEAATSHQLGRLSTNSVTQAAFYVEAQQFGMSLGPPFGWKNAAIH